MLKMPLLYFSTWLLSTDTKIQLGVNGYKMLILRNILSAISIKGCSLIFDIVIMKLIVFWSQ